MTGSYTIDAFVRVERGVEEDAVTIASSDKVVDLHVTNLDGDWDGGEVVLYTAVGGVNVYLRIDRDDALWLARRIVETARDPRLLREVGVA